MKDRFWAPLVALVGVGMTIGGVIGLSDDTVKCGSREMRAGDTCLETSRGGSATERSFDEQRSDNTRTGWLLLGGGVLMLSGGSFWTYSEFRKKRRTVGGPPSGQQQTGFGAADRQPGYPPQQYQPPQPYPEQAGGPDPSRQQPYPPPPGGPYRQGPD